MARTTKKTEQANLPAAKRPSHQRKFKTDQDYQNSFLHYIAVCEERKELANIAGFCVFCDMHRDTFYAQQSIYPDTHKKIQSALEDRAINYKSNAAMSIFYLKNKFGYSDKGEVASATLDVDIDADEETLDLMMSKLGYLPSPD